MNTYMMYGSDLYNDITRGVVARVIGYMFDYIFQTSE